MDTGISFLKVLSDSHVVLGQVNSEYAVNSDNLKDYAKRINLLAAQFQYFTLGKVEKINNNKAANGLAKISSGETPNDSRMTVKLLSTLEHIHHMVSNL